MSPSNPKTAKGTAALVKKQLKESTQSSLNALACPVPSLGIDLDGCVDECPIFFQALTAIWQGKIFIVSFRRDREKAVAALAEYNVRYDVLILVNSFNEKAEVIVRNGILVYFDDQPEMLKKIPPEVNVLLVRNGGNFDFRDRRWMMSAETGKIV